MAQSLAPDVAMFLGLLQSSALLQQALPKVRSQALMHALSATSTVEQAQHILLENLVGSPYIPDETKNGLAEMALSGKMAELRAALQCQRQGAEEIVAVSPTTTSFRDMVVAIFSHSRKMAQLEPTRRQALGAAIHTQRSIVDLKMFAMTALETSQAFDGTTRDLVANDILDDRYDLLLLPDRFDCDEKARVHVGPDDRESWQQCSICLGGNAPNTRLPCQHVFCRSCIVPWVNTHHDCPMCRAPARSEDLQPLSGRASLQ